MVRSRLRNEPPVGRQLKKDIQSLATPLESLADLDPLIDAIGGARFVLLGEASHGTHEYYTWRTAISRRLILEKGFTFIAVEGDWPDCESINAYLRGLPGSGLSALEVLQKFHRWPTWMWANREVEALAEWLKDHNRDRSADLKVSFHGLDVYSLWDSLAIVSDYLMAHHQDARQAIDAAVRCFEPYRENVQGYAASTRWLDQSCEDEVVRLLSVVERLPWPAPNEGGQSRFNVEQNALIARNAENYYRAMMRNGPESWNIRDWHMVETLNRLMDFHGPQSKAIIWEHNTHIGDARFTDMADAGMVNVGELIRSQQMKEDVFIVGFGSHMGSVIASHCWDGPIERLPVPAAHAGSWEEILSRATKSDSLLLFSEDRISDEMLAPRGQRAIGVVYHPEREHGNYVPTILPKRYDAFVFLHQTTALQPVQEISVDDAGEVPETFPTGV